MSPETKKSVHQECVNAIAERIQNVTEAIDMARESANEDGKSSAGDKHETGRAMAHLEQEKAVKQLNELLDQQNVLKRIDPTIQAIHAVLGSLVETNLGTFYLSIALGKLVVKGDEYLVISPASPMGKMLLGLSVGSKSSLNGREVVIKSIL